MIEIVGLSGKAGSGKDYLGQHYLQPLGYQPFSLSWHFKCFIIAQGLATYEEVFVTKPPHIRQLLQQAGTEQGRMVYGEDIWCNTVSTWLQILSDHMHLKKFYAPDIRFMNEVAWIKKLGGKVIRIQAPNRVKDNKLTLEARLHISETNLDSYTEFDAVIHNDYGDEEAVESELYTALDISNPKKETSMTEEFAVGNMFRGMQL